MLKKELRKEVRLEARSAPERSSPFCCCPGLSLAKTVLPKSCLLNDVGLSLGGNGLVFSSLGGGGGKVLLPLRAGGGGGGSFPPVGGGGGSFPPGGGGGGG